MSIPLFPKCWRGRDDCEPIHCIDAPPGGTTEEQYINLDYTPLSFVCGGCIYDEDRGIPQDAFRFCFKNAVTDEITDNDMQDLTHIMAVISTVMAVYATRITNGGVISVPTLQRKKEATNNKEGE